MSSHENIPKVAILVSTTNEWGRRLIKGILAYVKEVGPWHLYISESTPREPKELPKGWSGDGIIARVTTPELAQNIRDAGLPIVNVADTPLEGFSAPVIRTDDAIGADMAIRHFVDRGLRNVAFIGPAGNPNTTWYANTFQSNADSADLSFNLFRPRSDAPDEAQALIGWLKQLPKPVGVLAWGHHFAREVVDCCLAANISVPHDVAVLSGGYDELLSHACFPALSGILSPTDQIGYKAASLLHEQMQGKQVSSEPIYLPPRGIIEHLSTDTLAVEDPKLVQVVEFLQANAFKNISMTDILKAVPMARRSLERRFQKAFGRSLIDEIRRIRINKARTLLAETNLPMQDIAEICGYATYNYLTHVFKKTTGSTPRDYRKQFRM
ncbi:AraC family transcriptional regulator [Pelagicoccus mobilis]|uniref:DNA-binding transcriptional regulator n=1 Tax=Pelagicoccus mobilis TaxID=415221 RepID=A0A934VSK3_9BACT|nr:DNA-binding transcriptional regulator [Pelagicoccus mobilis]MBK1878599.1 DNA-binding transcriptional regulator [Pelagicoccus mobilis]